MDQGLTVETDKTRQVVTQRVRVDSGTHAVEWLLRTRAGQQILANAYASNERARCLCVRAPVPMYVAKRGNRYYLARMPGTGPLHASSCQSLDSANLLSGVDCYSDGALSKEADGSLRIRFDPGVGTGEQLAALGMNGLLDLLIEEAGLNVFESKGDPVVHSGAALERLRSAATKISIVDSGPLPRLLLVPELFDKDRADDQNERYISLLAGDPPPLVCSTLGGVQPSEYSWRIKLKHFPRLKFWLPRAAGELLIERSGGTFSFEQTTDALCLLQVKRGRQVGDFSVRSIAIRRIDRRKMPILSDSEAEVASRLVAENKSFMRPLRFDSTWTRVLADYLLLRNERDSLGFVFAPTGCVEYDEAKKRVAWPLIRGGAGISLAAGASGVSPKEMEGRIG
jgi:hypothetical protein